MLLVYGYGEANSRGWYIDNDNAYAFIQNPFSHHLIRIIADMALLLVMQMQAKVDETIAQMDAEEAAAPGSPTES